MTPTDDVMLPQPDQPRPFGYKTAWLALRTNTRHLVAHLLGLRETKVTSWHDGIERAYQNAVFVSPPLGVWTLAVGLPLFPLSRPAAFVKSLLNDLSTKLGEAQFFCTHRGVETHVWARAVDGRLLRGYGYSGERGETLWDEGGQTREERDLGFKFFDERSPEVDEGDYWARDDLTFPDEDCVMRIAGAWSLDPTTIGELFSSPGLGLAGSFKWVD